MSEVAPSLDRLLAPRSIALVGASESAYFSASALKNLRGQDYPGQLWPVNPRREEVSGLRAYPTLGDLPGVPDHVMVVVPRDPAMEAVRQAAELGVGGITVISAGFADDKTDEGRAAQAELTAIAAATGTPIQGPNCMGYLNAFASTAALAGDLRGRLRAGPVAIVAQSGGVGIALYRSLMERGLGVGLFITCGNEAVLDATAYLKHLLRDERIKVACCFIEAFRDPSGIAECAALATETGTALVVLKSGSSDRGRRAALAHTGALAGSDEMHDALFRKLGIVRVLDLEEFTETAALLAASSHWDGWEGERVGVVAISGGTCSIVADLAARRGLDLPDLSPATRDALVELIPEGSSQNPIDATGFAVSDTKVYGEITGLLEDDEAVDTIVSVLTTGLPAEGMDNQRRLLDVIVDSLDTPTKPQILATLGHYGFRPDEIDFLAAHPQLAVLNGLGAGVVALRHVVDLNRRRKELRQLPAWRPTHGQRPGDPAPAPVVLNEWDSLRMVEDAGVPCVERALVATPEELGPAAADLGFPVVVKLCSPDAPHKAKLGLVAVGVPTAEAAVAHGRAMLERFRDALPEGAVDGFVVSRMLTGFTEVLLGVESDPQLGSFIIVGSGGSEVEVLRDSVLLPVPLDDADVERSIRSLRLLPARLDRAGADWAALRAAIAALEGLVLAEGPRLASLDVNPLCVLAAGQGAVAVDALAILAGPAAP